MEKHKCKLCFRSFSNGRALGGHMRSHMMSLPIPPKLSEEADSASSRSEQLFREEKRRQYEQNDAEFEDDDKSLFYGLRENPKRSVKLVDPEFSMMMILQDRESESETESSKNPTRRRSRRTRRPDKAEPWAAEPEPEPEPASSISDATTEEDVAFCLMMMSRDNWRKRKRRSGRNDDFEVGEDFENDEEEEEEEEESEFEGAEKRQQSGKCAKANYKCETCDKVFRSYQALGGHRASHKKVKLGQSSVVSESNDNVFVKERVVRERERNAVADKKSHQCPVCFRVLSSGQALGGHKRSHVIAAETTPATKTTSPIARSPVVVLVDRASSKSNKLGESLIDLNLPAPDYDDDDETSQVSDAEFVNNPVIRQ